MRSGPAGGIAGLAAFLLCGVAAAQPQRPVTDDSQACVTVANLTEYNWPIGVRREGRVNSTLIAKPREVNRYCAPDRLGPNEFIIVQVKSSWFPVGECRLKNRGTMEIYREKSTETDSGEVTRVKCYEGR
jgi:hypothetical protein